MSEPLRKKLGSPIDDLRGCLTDFKSGFLEQKNILTVLGLSTTVTALFLGIETEDPALKRVQALLLLGTILSLIIILLFSFRTFFRTKQSELYQSITLCFFLVAGFLIINLLTFLWNGFGQELIFLLKWLGFPLFFVLTNLLFIYVFRLFRWLRGDLDGRLLENFFLISFGLYLVITYLEVKMDPLSFWRELAVFDFNKFLLIYQFGYTLLDEFFFYPFVRRFESRKMRLLLELSSLPLLFLPLIIKYAFPSLFELVW